MNTNPLQKTIISVAIASALSLGATTASADIYEFAYANGGPGDGLFTMLDPTGIQMRNTSNPYYSDTTWRYGLRTQIGGSLSYDSTTRAGAIKISPFDFFNGGPASASGITFKKEVSSDLILTQMGFNWNGNDISTQVVLDGSGLFAALPTIAINDTIDLASCTGGSLDGLCALPASNGIKNGTVPIGPAPLVTSSYNVAGNNGTVTVLANLSLGADDGIGGSPMDNGPFVDNNANFDFASLTLTGYNDTTAPIITLTTNTITVPLGTAFDVNNPGAAGFVSCSDAVDGTDTLDAGANANISFTVGGDVVDVNTAAEYTVTYTCSDNADQHAWITDDPNNPGNATVPTDNVSSVANLIVKVNATPVANTYDQALFSNETLVINFTTTDLTLPSGEFIATDANGDTLTFSSINATATGDIITANSGTVAGVGTGELTYTPATGYVGSDSFTFTVNDGSVDSTAGTVNLDVKNVLPVAGDDTAGVLPSDAVIFNVLGNDTDVEDGSSLAEPAVTVGNIVQGTHGIAVANGNGTITYTAGAITVDPTIDTFTYTVTDSDGGESAPATVTITISNTLNTAPVAYDSAFTIDAGAPLTINMTTSTGGGPGGIIADDMDAAIQTLSFVNVSATTTQGGTVTVTTTTTTNDTLIYTPADGYNALDAATDTFSFKVSDGIETSAVVNTMTITVNALPPTANDDTPASMLLGDTLNIDVAANDSDVEDDANGAGLVTVTPATPSSGTATAIVPANGTIDYTPTVVGAHTFTYTVNDSDGNSSNAATVTVNVTAAPVSQNAAKTTDEDISFSINVTDVATDLDVGDTLTFNSKTDGLNGTVAISDHVTNGPNTILTYTPNANFNGTDSFNYTVTDGSYASNTSTVTVTVNAVDDAMVCQNAGFTTAVDTPLQITSNNLIGGCTDVDGPVTLASYTQPTVTGSTVTDDGAGNLTYTPNTGYVGADNFTFTASDGSGVTGNRTYTASIAVIDNPAIHVITGGNFTMLTATGALVGGSTDVSGVFDERLICNIESCSDIAMTTSLASSQPFLGPYWESHDARVFGPGSYTFDSACGATDIAAGITNCGGGAPLSMLVANGQLGAHMLFNYGVPAATSCGLVNCDIDVAVVWDYNAAFGSPIENGSTESNCPGDPYCDMTMTGTRQWNWTSVDPDGGDGIRGIAMVDGPFGGFNANFNLDMTAGYTPPVANDDNVGTKPSNPLVIDVIANDVDAEEGAPPAGITVTLLSATSIQGGTLQNNLDGTVTYTPPGTLIIGDADSFQYTLTDVGGAVSVAATVNITITNNTAPVANNVGFTADEDVTLTINVTDLDDLATAIGSDIDGDALTFATFDATSAQGGTVTVDATNSILSYTPQAHFNGTDTFTFTVNDGVADSTVAIKTITVNPVNDAVVCTDVTLATAVDTPLTIVAATDLITGCTDIEGDTITFVSAAPPANPASTVVDNAGTLIYTPEMGLTGNDSFVFIATDGNGGNGTATAKVQVGTVFGNFTMLDKQGNVFGGTNDVVFTWDGVSMHSAETDLVSNMTIVSEGETLFFSAPWFAHHVRVFGPGTYTFEADNKLCQSKSASPDAANTGTKTIYGTADDIDDTGCPGTGTATTMSMTIAEGQIGVHMLFDYNGSFDIDVVNVYNMNAAWNDPTGQGDALNDLWVGAAGASPDPTTDWGLVSTDVNGDGVNGAPMVDGPFVGFYANFNDAPGGTAPPPAAITTTVRDTSVGGALSWLVLLGMLPLISLFRMRMK